MKFICGRIEEYVYGKWRPLRREGYKDSLICPEQYQNEFGKNIADRFRLKCPCVGFNGEPCDAILDFTNGENTPFFSTKDGYEHVHGCLYGEGGKKRQAKSPDAIDKNINFNSFLVSSSSSSSSSSDGDEDNDSIKDDTSQEYDDSEYSLDEERTDENNDEINQDSTEYGDDYSDNGGMGSPSDKCEVYRPRIEKLNGFEKIAALALSASPYTASNNAYLVNDSTICRRTAEIFNERMIEMKPGDPMLVVASGWKLLYSICSRCQEGKKTEDAIRCREANGICRKKKCKYNGCTSFFFLNNYIANEFTHIFELRIDKLNFAQRSKWFKRYNAAFDTAKSLDVETDSYSRKALPSFIMGVEYVGTKRAVIAGRERIIDIFSLHNAKNFIVFTEFLQEVDDSNLGM